MSVAEASKVNPDSYFELLDPSAASFTFQTFADGKRDPGLAAIFEGTLAHNKRLKGSPTLMSIEEAYKRGGAPELTRFIFGRDGRAERRRFSHLASTGSIPGVFKMRGLWAGRKSKLLTLGWRDDAAPRTRRPLRGDPVCRDRSG
jgi:hypothetical protein